MKLKILLTLVLLTVDAFSCAPKSDAWWKVVESAEVSTNHNGAHAVLKDEALKGFSKMKTFLEWVDYEDEFLKLRYPKHPMLKFQVEEGVPAGNFEGGGEWRKKTHIRKYQLMAGAKKFQEWQLSPAGWFDDRG